MKIIDVLEGQKTSMREDARAALTAAVNGYQCTQRAALSAFLLEAVYQIPGMLRPTADLLYKTADLFENLKLAEDLDESVENFCNEIFPDLPEYK